MNRIAHILISLLLLCGLLTSVSAQSLCDSTVVQQFQISYPINDTELHEDYLDNAASLRIIKEYFLKSPRIDSIIIYSYASPDGPYNFNRKLAEERGKRARSYLLQIMPEDRIFPDSLIIIKPTAENWEGLYESVAGDQQIENKEEILEIISRKDISDNTKKQMLKRLNGGASWKYISTYILPRLRYARWIAEWVYVPYIAESIPSVAAITSKAEHISYLLPKPRPLPAEKGAKTILALKTNLLYDVLSLTNFSIEAPIYKDKVSILYYHQFPWWTWGQADNEYCIRYLSIGAEARWWFKAKDRLQGHFLGAYAESGKYDFEFQRRICYQGEFYSTGLTYGYAMPVGKHINLEFSLSAGYASLAYRGYSPSEDYEILWRDPNKVGRVQYFGPTKAQISLVIPISIKTNRVTGR